MLGVGSLGNIKIIPSGGITPENAAAWLDAGAFAVGMGSKLVGSDTKCLPVACGGTEAALAAARHAWVTEGKAKAQVLLDQMNTRK